MLNGALPGEQHGLVKRANHVHLTTQGRIQNDQIYFCIYWNLAKNSMYPCWFYVFSKIILKISNRIKSNTYHHSKWNLCRFDSLCLYLNSEMILLHRKIFTSCAQYPPIVEIWSLSKCIYASVPCGLFWVHYPRRSGFQEKAKRPWYWNSHIDAKQPYCSYIYYGTCRL